MSYKTIAAYINRPENAERVSSYACMVARKFNAHLIGIYLTETTEVHSGVGAFLNETIIENYRRSQEERMVASREVFLKHARNEDFVSEWRTDSNYSNSGNTLCEIARCTDLIIMPQTDPEKDHSIYATTLETVVRQSGRPVLVIPFAGKFATVGEHPLVGWSATREATRAIHDALPFLASAKQTTVMTVTSSVKSENLESGSANELAAVLDRHGASITVTKRPKGEISIGDQLLNEAFESGADLIVTGAYGHSAIYDFVIGATTTHILEHMTAPVLLSS